MVLLGLGAGRVASGTTVLIGLGIVWLVLGGDSGTLLLILGGLGMIAVIGALFVFVKPQHRLSGPTGAKPRREAIPPSVRATVHKRDGGVCVDCGAAESLEYDHIIPISRGGANTARNLERAGIVLPACPPGVADDDLLDAAAAAWTAVRYGTGRARALPGGHTERIGAIWA